ncbi:hypothetical protein F8C76_06045 [Flagellimonas olearia]|uniref:BIG2 domain-containing protein n=1 Tax=Flagellimonas olearia TaxID=552546 RepID=A0A6I1EBB9_9FLAO|nr:IPT/TIG domain-containing protein [Allomuricauda olearia]KAB7531054.1 hypothetical protein F8C76_06045 [Allomuricauda olearia]
MKKIPLQASLTLLLCLFAFSCGKDEPNDPDPVDTSPSITGFSPTSGPVGTSVTINGTNFSATASDNTVKFGTVATSVDNASTTTLKVTVPEGAQTAKISVTVGGETATSSNDFTVTNPDPTTIALDQETMELKTLDTNQLTATVTGAGANETVVWNSDNEEAALVDQEGNVTATGTGTATITATVDEVTTSCAITVNPGIIVGGTVESDSDAIGVASYWINGTKIELNDGNSEEVSLDVSGTDVYTTFVEYSVDAIYVRVMKNTALHSTLGGMDNNYKTPYAIDVVDNDVYVCGFEYNGSFYDAKYWKNGDEIILSDGSDAVSTDIEVHGGSVFVSGYQEIDGQYEAFYWKDGTPTQHNTMSDLGISAWDIFIDDLGDIYTAGNEGAPNQNQPYVWKNGEELYILGNGDIEGTAYAVTVKNGNVFAVSESATKECGLWINGNMVSEWSGYARAMTVLNGTIYVAGTKYDGNINSYTPTVFTFDTSGNLIEEISLPSDGSDGYATSIVVK